VARNDQRRRRVVIDGALHDDEDVERLGAGEMPSRSGEANLDAPADPYDRRASRTFQPRTTDFIPKRPWAVVLLICAVLAVVALINAGYYLTQNAPAEVAQRFALVGTGTLSAWCSSLLMLACCLASLQIYAIRQHRQDDYQGTYRVWLLFSGVLLLTSLHCVIDLGGLFANLWTGEARPGVNSFLGSGVTVLALGGIFFRGLVEVRASTGTLTLVCAAWVIYVLSIMMQFPQLESRLVEFGLDQTEALYGNTMWAGHTLLFISLVVYARNLFLTSNGLMALPVPKQKKKKSTQSTSKTKGTQRTTSKKRPSKTSIKKKAPPAETSEQIQDSEEVENEDLDASADEVATKPQTIFGRALPESKRSAPSPLGPLSGKIRGYEVAEPQTQDEDEDDDQTSANGRLSKAERRKMRKQQASTRRAA
jgi:hypothetical protein